MDTVAQFNKWVGDKGYQLTPEESLIARMAWMFAAEFYYQKGYIAGHDAKTDQIHKALGISSDADLLD